jgi:hypothetical protein
MKDTIKGLCVVMMVSFTAAVIVVEIGKAIIFSLVVNEPIETVAEQQPENKYSIYTQLLASSGGKQYTLTTKGDH